MSWVGDLWGRMTEGAARIVEAKRMSDAERQEWTALPGRIEELEQELHELQERLGDPEFLRGDPEEIRAASQRVKEIPEQIDIAFERWGELDARA